jgi:antitoxin HicB
VKVPLVFASQPEGGFTVTSPVRPELITEGDWFDEALENVRDALAAVIESYQEMRRERPPGIERE